jgi:uncharacterized membrane protein
MNKDEMIISIFSDRTDAESAIEELKSLHYNAQDISIVTRDREDAQAVRDNTGSSIGDGLTSGAATGGVIGGLAGLLIGVGAITIPGLGALLVAGPLAAALGLTGAAASTVTGAVAGAVTGGLVGALVGIGVPQEDATVYEDRVKTGGILLAVPIRERSEAEVRTILEDNGADRVKAFTMSGKRHSLSL